MKTTLFLSLTILVSSFVIVNYNYSPKNGKELVQEMHDKYNKRWYQTLTFTQKTTFYQEGKESRVQMWFEAMDLNNGLIIKFDSIESGGGILFAADTQYVYQQNKIVNKVRRVHDLLVLGFTIYSEDVSKSIVKLTERGYNLEKIADGEYNGTKCFVVGDEGKQFWIDKENLIFHKLTGTNPQGGISEIQFNNYKKLGKGWIAPEVIFLNNNVITMKEEYSEIKIPKKLASTLFDPNQFSKAVW